MDSFFQNKKYIVTGATSGIGYAIAMDLAKYGAIIGIHHHRSLKEVHSQIQSIQELSPLSISLQGDLRISGMADKVVQTMIEQFGEADGLVNNAGAIYQYGDFQELSMEAWDWTFAVNARAPFEMIRALWPYFLEKKGGRVVNISSATVGYSGSLRSVHYVAAKAALEAISKTFAKDGVRDNILVNVLRLGLMNTPMHTRTPGYTPQHLESRAKLVPIGRMGEGVEAAAWVRYLLGPDAGFMTGQIIGLTGGD